MSEAPSFTRFERRIDIHVASLSLARELALQAASLPPQREQPVATPQPTFGTLLGVEMVCGLLMTAYFAPVPALLSELLATPTRTTDLSLSNTTSKLIAPTTKC